MADDVRSCSEDSDSSVESDATNFEWAFLCSMMFKSGREQSCEEKKL